MNPHNRYLSNVRIFAVAFSFLFASLSSAQGQNPPNTPSTVPGYVMTTPPTIDGVVDDAVEWKDVPSFEGLVDAETGSPGLITAKFWLAYDSKYIYFAGKFPDADPSKIKATEYRTNVSMNGNDVIALIVDPFNNLSEFNVFQINPRGATNARIAGGRAAKREWVGEIYAKGRITPEGWEAEARIPWSIMRLPSAGVHDLRINTYRYSPRINRDHSWRYIEGSQAQNTPIWTNVTVPPGPPKVLRFLPYTYVGYDKKDKSIVNSGLDLKTQLTDSLDFVGTINPDFRNIENQVLSLDFSYFERLAGESRPFFLEGGNYFETSDDASIFTTQRINAFDVGAKVYGKLGDRTDLAILNTSDFGNRNALVFNAHNQISTHKSLRFAYSGLDDKDLRNDAFHTEFRNGAGPWDWFYQFAGTTDSETKTGQRHNTGFSYNNAGVNGDIQFSSVTDKFNPRLGFAPQTGFRGVSGSFDMTHPLKRGPLLEEGYSLFARNWDTFGGKTYLHELDAFTSSTWRNGMDFDAGYLLTEFDGNKDHVVFLSLERPRGDSYRHWQVDYQFGKVSNQDYKQTTLSLNYRPLPMLQMVGSYQIFEFGGRETQTILSANYDLGNDRSISGRAVQQGGDWNAYVAYRRSGNAGMEYFLILGDPNAQKFRSSLILKVTYPLQMLMGRRGA